MTRYFVAVLVVGLLLAAAPAPTEGDDVKKEREKLKGTWRAVSAEASGKPITMDDVDVILTFDKNTFELKIGVGIFAKGTFTLNPSQKPKSIDFTIVETHHKDIMGKTWHGIYELEKDTLKWCAVLPGEKDRPKEFVTKEGDKHEFYTFKKE